jgi:hypothetical protein
MIVVQTNGSGHHSLPFFAMSRECMAQTKICDKKKKGIDGINLRGHCSREMKGGTMGPILNGLQFAKKINRDPKTVRKWLRAGNCPVKPIPGMKPPAWRLADVEAFIAGKPVR